MSSLTGSALLPNIIAAKKMHARALAILILKLKLGNQSYSNTIDTTNLERY
jgi:hypothetical protein